MPEGKHSAVPRCGLKLFVITTVLFRAAQIEAASEEQISELERLEVPRKVFFHDHHFPCVDSWLLGPTEKFFRKSTVKMSP